VQYSSIFVFCVFRYSGLTGACINCTTLNNLIGQSLSNVPYQQRIQRYSRETNWSNREVVKRGTGANFGFDAFLRPGFPYAKLVDYLFDKAIEAKEVGSLTEPLLSKSWQSLVASSLVPREMETENDFFVSASMQMKMALEDKFVSQVSLHLKQHNKEFLRSVAVEHVSKLTANWKAQGSIHTQFGLSQLTPDERQLTRTLSDDLVPVAECLIACLHQAVEEKILDQRRDAEVFHQPKPLDAVPFFDLRYQIDSFGHMLAIWASLTALAFSFLLANQTLLPGAVMILNALFAALIAGDLNRIKSRLQYAKSELIRRLSFIRKAVFSLQKKERRQALNDPFFASVQRSISEFYELCSYYEFDDLDLMDRVYKQFTDSVKSERDIVLFMKKITSDLVSVTCHSNSYIQQQLVAVYSELDDYLSLRRDESLEADLQVEIERIWPMLDKVETLLDSNPNGRTSFIGRMRLRSLVRNVLRRLQNLPQRACNQRVKRAIVHLDHMLTVLKHHQSAR
jgi:hypothetical protein